MILVKGPGMARSLSAGYAGVQNIPTSPLKKNQSYSFSLSLHVSTGVERTLNSVVSAFMNLYNLHNYFKFDVCLYFRRRRVASSRPHAPPEELASPRSGDPSVYYLSTH